MAIRESLISISKNFPKLTRATLSLTSRILPDKWVFCDMVANCGGTFPTQVRLGNGMKVNVGLGDMVGCHISSSGWYEHELVKYVRSVLTPDTIFFDIGAHVGQYSMLAAPIVRQVHAFEPSPITFKFLKQNVADNHLSNVTINQCAVSDLEGNASLGLSSPANPGGNSLLSTGEEQVPVRCTTIDAYTKGMELTGMKIVMKIDVEGAEEMVLSGARHLMSHSPTIIFERFGDKPLTLPGFKIRQVQDANFVAVCES